ncbi:MAG: aldo/keto reductase [Proteobacteria bacterium]|nr:aldo/keto reductase [Pseudomonadota bacterium]
MNLNPNYEQLAKLKTDRIDYYLVHALNSELWEAAKNKGVIDFLEDALKQGRIVNAGFSFHGPAEEFQPIIDDYDWTFCQIQYNFLDTRNQAGTPGLKYAASKDLAVMIMEPLRGGNLAKTPPPSVKRIWNKADQKRPPVDWSLSWIWNHPEVTVILSGMNDNDDISENISLASQCKDCGKCVDDCPQGLTIPDLLEAVADDMEGWMTKPMIWMGKRIMRVKKNAP